VARPAVSSRCNRLPGLGRVGVGDEHVARRVKRESGWHDHAGVRRDERVLAVGGVDAHDLAQPEHSLDIGHYDVAAVVDRDAERAPKDIGGDDLGLAPAVGIDAISPPPPPNAWVSLTRIEPSDANATPDGSTNVPPRDSGVCRPLTGSTG
jgi:hypothetical protein